MERKIDRLPVVERIQDSKFVGTNGKPRRRALLSQRSMPLLTVPTSSSRSISIFTPEEAGYNTSNLREKKRVVWVDVLKPGVTEAELQAKLDEIGSEIIERRSHEPIVSDRYMRELFKMDAALRTTAIRNYWRSMLAPDLSRREGDSAPVAKHNDRAYCYTRDLAADSGSEVFADEDYRDAGIPESMRAVIEDGVLYADGRIFMPAEWVEAALDGWVPEDEVIELKSEAATPAPPAVVKPEPVAQEAPPVLVNNVDDSYDDTPLTL